MTEPSLGWRGYLQVNYCHYSYSLLILYLCKLNSLMRACSLKSLLVAERRRNVNIDPTFCTCLGVSHPPNFRAAPSK